MAAAAGSMGHEVKKFGAIEGLRGWLAWGVVFSHIPYLTGFQMKGVDAPIRSLGSFAVLTFMIISGFVITHLIIEKPEPYVSYIIKRFARLFPLFAITCVAGFLTSDLLALAVASDPAYADPFEIVIRGVAESNHKHFWPHVATHMAMLQNLIPNWLLPYSDYAFNIPAWSISLEWQFYLVAPLVVYVLRNKPNLILALAFTVAVSAIGLKKLYGVEPRVVPLAANFFLAGIVSRLIYSEIVDRNWLVFVLALVIVIFPLNSNLRPFLIWLVVLFGLSQTRAVRPNLIGRLYDFALTSAAARYFGSRSYSTYLCHYPVISLIVWSIFKYTGQVPAMLLVTLLTIPSVILVSELAYRFIEIPGIQWGKRVSARWSVERGELPAASSAVRTSALSGKIIAPPSLAETKE